MIEGYATVNEIAQKWDISVRAVQMMCAEGRIKDATKFGKAWAIPVKINRPNDGRVISGKYKNWRKKGVVENGK